jgi:hypothetical protein
MKNRWIGVVLLALALSLGACAPPGQGGGSSDGSSPVPSVNAAESMGAESMGAEPSMEPSEAAPAPSYDYDY